MPILTNRVVKFSRKGLMLMTLVCAVNGTLLMNTHAQIMKTESTKLNGDKAIKLFAPYSNSIYWVIAGNYLGEDALSLAVGHRHATSVCEGLLIVTKSKVAFKSHQLTDHNFIYDRSMLKYFNVNPWKSFGQTIYEQISVKTENKDYNFYPLSDTNQLNSQGKDFPFILFWFADAITNFEKAWKTFDRDYSKNLNPEELISTSGRKYKIQESYDKFKDETTYSTSWMLVPGIGEILVLFTSKGKTPSKPEYYQFLIAYPQARDRIASYDKSVIFLADSERIKLANTDLIDIRLHLYTGLTGSSTNTTIIGTIISFDKLQKIAGSRSVEFQIENSEGKLDADHKEILTRLLSVIK